MTDDLADDAPWVPDAATHRLLGSGLQAGGLLALLGTTSVVLELSTPPRDPAIPLTSATLADGLFWAATLPLAVGLNAFAKAAQSRGDTMLSKAATGGAGLAVAVALLYGFAVAGSIGEPAWQIGLGLAFGLVVLWLVALPFTGRTNSGKAAGGIGGVILLGLLKVGHVLLNGNILAVVVGVVLVVAIAAVLFGYPFTLARGSLRWRDELGEGALLMALGAILAPLVVAGTLVAVFTGQPNVPIEPWINWTVNLGYLASLLLWSAGSIFAFAALRARRHEAENSGMLAPEPTPDA